MFVLVNSKRVKMAVCVKKAGISGLLDGTTTVPSADPFFRTFTVRLAS